MFQVASISQLVRASDRHAADAGSIPRAARDFKESTFSADSVSVPVHPLCACINICVHDRDPVVHVRVRWITATQTYPARTISDKDNQLDDCGRSTERRE